MPFVPSRPNEGLMLVPPLTHLFEPPSQRPEQPIKRVELPLFEGHNPDDWLFCVEKCFEMNQTLEFEKLDQALTCLTGPAFIRWCYS